MIVTAKARTTRARALERVAIVEACRQQNIVCKSVEIMKGHVQTHLKAGHLTKADLEPTFVKGLIEGNPKVANYVENYKKEAHEAMGGDQ